MSNSADAPQRFNVTGVFGQRPRTMKTSEVVAREIALEILNAKLPEGTPLAIERNMVEDFGIGRNTLRESLRLLETWGIIRIRTGRHGGPVVRDPQPHDLNTPITLLLRFNEASIVNVLEARMSLDPTMARLAAQQITDEQILELEDTVQRMLDDPDDPQRFRVENARFNQVLAEACANPVIRILLNALKSVTETVLIEGAPYPKERRLTVASSHARLIEALKRRDPADSAAAMSDHLEDAHTYWISQHPDDIGTRPVPLL